MKTCVVPLSVPEHSGLVCEGEPWFPRVAESEAFKKRDPEVTEPAVPARRVRKRGAPPLPREPTFDRPEEAEEGQPTRKGVTKRAPRKNGRAALRARINRSGTGRKPVTPQRPPRA